MIKFVELIEDAGVKLSNYKIHCATGEGANHPLEAFFAGKWKTWQEHQNQENFKCEQILSLIHLGKMRWLFGGVFRVSGVKARSPIGFRYSTEELGGLDHLVGRAIIEFNKSFRSSYLRGVKYGNELLVAAIRELRMTVGEFPGFNKVLLSHNTLTTLVNELNPSWRGALRSVAGIYLITDNLSGKMYVGSACGGDGIWQRWTAYATNGHGGNEELKKLLQLKGIDHVKHFQYAILEVCDVGTGEKDILKRESHWKDVLRTREFGLNGKKWTQNHVQP